MTLRQRITQRLGAAARLEREVDSLRVQIGWLQSQAVRSAASPGEAEFRVFSQYGEDGIIQFLAQRVPIETEVFVEFGVEDYRESNTRLLLEKDNWRGLIIDAGSAHRELIDRSQLAWRHSIDAITAFIDRDNINGLISGAGIEGDIGLLSIDIDGNDYWVLQAIDVVSPRILVVEYNSVFGPSAEITIPYDPAFDRSRAHPSNLYFGVSLGALARLASEKGYALIGSDRAGVNAFFLRRDVLGEIPEEAVADAYVASRLRESRDETGALTHVTEHSDRVALIAEMPVIDVGSGARTTVGAAVAQPSESSSA
jgi:hypothetical protein